MCTTHGKTISAGKTVSEKIVHIPNSRFCLGKVFAQANFVCNLSDLNGLSTLKEKKYRP